MKTRPVASNTWKQIDNFDPKKEIKKGGNWAPSGCMSRQKVAVVVPYRDRPDHLKSFLTHVHHLLAFQQTQHTIVVVEQVIKYLLIYILVLDCKIVSQYLSSDKHDDIIFWSRHPENFQKLSIYCFFQCRISRVLY